MRLSWRTCIPFLLLTLGLPSFGTAQVRLSHMQHITLDPGHGGFQPGTIAEDGTPEKKLTLAIALKVEKLLRTYTNARVTLTRRTDQFVGLRERTRIANQVGSDLLLSIHCNGSHSEHSHGVETYFLAYDSANAEIAKMVEREERMEEQPNPAAPATNAPPNMLTKILEETSRFGAHADSEKVAEVILKHLPTDLKARRRGVFQAPFAVLKEADMPAVVVEVGFLSHAKEGQKLKGKAYQNKIAKAIYKSIIELDRNLTRR